MSHCQKDGDGKDIIIFATKEDHDVPSSVSLPDPEPTPGLILPNGEINWNCPCLGGMATGPCGVPFREAFSCFHYSEAEPKGSDCFEKFREMQDCMSQYPTLYNKQALDEDDDESNAIEQAFEQSDQITNDTTSPELENSQPSLKEQTAA